MLTGAVLEAQGLEVQASTVLWLLTFRCGHTPRGNMAQIKAQVMSSITFSMGAWVKQRRLFLNWDAKAVLRRSWWICGLSHSYLQHVMCNRFVREVEKGACQ